PLPDASVSVLMADLPFGQLVGSHRDNEVLYPRIVAEAARVAAPGARMVLLTHEVRLLERVAAEQRGSWELVRTVRVRSSGMTPRLFLFRRAG
ncbi:MAG: RNA methyltransferase, partial [Chloroflexota bacterium]